MGYTPQFPNTGVELATPQAVLRPGGRDGFEEYYFEGADIQTTFQLPQTPHTPRPPNTPPTPHVSTSRGVTGGHDSNANKWRKNSNIAQQNRNVADANGSTARHTAGSIGFGKHHNNLEKMIGKPPTQFDVFMKTHGTIEAKKRYFAGDHKNLEYCSLTAKEAQVDRLHAQLSTMEQQQQQMKEQMEMVMRMMNMSGNQPRAPPDNPPEDN
ncbi:unnamed protein product [Lactuca saligna]|uniref:Uncharacterized protein n=1 Tax=Lactuca saligna TaxID=75948 RepID=A0AA35ZG63_LACSI|nr:unnamed protein product [Lactuca saligna]